MAALQAADGQFESAWGHCFGGTTMVLRFPINGIHKGAATISQPEGTTFDAKNVRVFDVLEDRARGGQRPGLDKWGTGNQIGSLEEPVVAMCVVGSLR
jgi:hypothetical protein